jgi:sulfide:quinone oxidoreductase
VYIIKRNSKGFGNPRGFIPVDEYYRHKKCPNVYVVGVAVALPPADETPVPVNFPKTGHMTEQMAQAAVSHLLMQLGKGKAEYHVLTAECIMDTGGNAVHMVADPIRPPRNRSYMSEGKTWLWAKEVFAHYYLWKMKKGIADTPKWIW